MRKFKFGKLVRDNIVDSIISSGNNPRWKTLSEKEYINELKKKLGEEASELVVAKGEEVESELVDIQEIVDNLLEVLKISKEELVKAQDTKNKVKGSFKKRQYVDTVEVKDNASEIEYYLKHPDKYPEVK